MEAEVREATVRTPDHFQAVIMTYCAISVWYCAAIADVHTVDSTDDTAALFKYALCFVNDQYSTVADASHKN